MNQVVMVPIPLSPEAAEPSRQDPAKLAMMADLVSLAMTPGAAADDPLIVLMDAVGRRAWARGLTDEAVGAELAAWNAEGRS